MQSVKPPKELWYATTEFRQPGKWLAKEVFYLDKPYFPDVVKPMKCHVLYETPMAALISLRKAINDQFKLKSGSIRIFLYSVRLDLITKGNYFSPEKVNAKDLFPYDRDLVVRHLVRQSLVFLRAANLEISFNHYSKEPFQDMYFEDHNGKEKFLMTLRQPKVTYTAGQFAKYQNKAIETAFFNLTDFPVILKPHTENKDAGKRDLDGVTSPPIS